MVSRNASSTATVRKFKGSTVYDWDSEPSDERPSEFTAGAAVSVPAHRAATGLEQRRARPARKRGGLSTLAVSMLLLGVSAGACMLLLARWLR